MQLQIYLALYEAVVWIRIRIHFGRRDPYPQCEYGSGSSARNYRPSFRENKPNMLVFND